MRIRNEMNNERDTRMIIFTFGQVSLCDSQEYVQVMI